MPWSKLTNDPLFRTVVAKYTWVPPVIGLLGTVYGILAAFQNLATKATDPRALVFPGIFEALLLGGLGGIALLIVMLLHYWYLKKT